MTITLNKPLNSGMGVSIVAAKVTASVLMCSLTGSIQTQTICQMSLLTIILPLILPQGAGQGNLGIYIKSIVKGGPAEMVRANTFFIIFE